MRYRRIICFLMGVWIGVSALLALEVFQSFNAVDDVLRTPPERVSLMFKALGPDRARALLRYTAGRQNVSTFEDWEDIQLALGLLISGMLFIERPTRALSPVTLAMTLLVAFVHFKITPELSWLGSGIEFVPWTAESQLRDQFWNLHRLYLVLDIVKCLIGLTVAVVLFTQHSGKSVRRRSRRGDPEMMAEVNRESALD